MEIQKSTVSGVLSGLELAFDNAKEDSVHGIRRGVFRAGKAATGRRLPAWPPGGGRESGCRDYSMATRGNPVRFWLAGCAIMAENCVAHALLLKTSLEWR